MLLKRKIGPELLHSLLTAYVYVIIALLAFSRAALNSFTIQATVIHLYLHTSHIFAHVCPPQVQPCSFWWWIWRSSSSSGKWKRCRCCNKFFVHLALHLHSCWQDNSYSQILKDAQQTLADCQSARRHSKPACPSSPKETAKQSGIIEGPKQCLWIEISNDIKVHPKISQKGGTDWYNMISGDIGICSLTFDNPSSLPLLQYRGFPPTQMQTIKTWHCQ